MTRSNSPHLVISTPRGRICEPLYDLNRQVEYLAPLFGSEECEWWVSPGDPWAEPRG